MVLQTRVQVFVSLLSSDIKKKVTPELKPSQRLVIGGPFGRFGGELLPPKGPKYVKIFLSYKKKEKN